MFLCSGYYKKKKIKKEKKLNILLKHNYIAKCENCLSETQVFGLFCTLRVQPTTVMAGRSFFTVFMGESLAPV